MILVDICDMKVSSNPNDTLATPAIGSCIAVSVYDPTVHAGGILHFMLPLSKSDPAKAKALPYMFADTGVPRLFQAMYELGASKQNMLVRVIGAAEVMGDKQLFGIGRRNYLVLKKMFLKNAISIANEDVGGNFSRRLTLQIGSGKCAVQFQGKEKEL